MNWIIGIIGAAKKEAIGANMEILMHWVKENMVEKEERMVKERVKVHSWATVTIVDNRGIQPNFVPGPRNRLRARAKEWITEIAVFAGKRVILRHIAHRTQRVRAKATRARE